MRQLFIISLSLGILLLSSSTPTKEYPQDFRPPTDHTIRLSGTFGELRPNHFHAGIDIKPTKGIGQNLYAIGDGYVARVKVQAGSYGNCLYINHPNGYTSVYAHLNKFPKKIAEYIKQKQYDREKFGVDLQLSPNEFSVKKGDVVGYLGTSGRSFGPHLHFEIRDTKSEKPINPLLFGFKVADNNKPFINELMIYHLNKKHEEIGKQKTKLKKIKGGNYRLSQDTITIKSWRAGFAVRAFDQMSGVPNWNGIYALEMLQDGKLIYDFKMEKIGFDETRYINAHSDYYEKVRRKKDFNRCYVMPGNKLGIYGKKNGVVELHKDKPSKIEIIVKDVKDNKCTLTFWVKRGEVTPPQKLNYNYLLPYNEQSIVNYNGLQLRFPKGSFYENLYLKCTISKENSEDVYSPTYHIDKHTTPVHKYYDIAIKPTHVPEELKDKMYIAYCEKDNKTSSVGGKWENDYLVGSARDMGDFCIMADTRPPKITPVSFKKNMKGMTKMSFKVKDELTDIAAFRATVDGKWVLLEYDAKNDLLIHRFDKRIGKGTHQLRLVVTDECKNHAVYEREFIR